MKKFTAFFTYIIGKVDELSTAAQKSLVLAITSYTGYCYKICERKNSEEEVVKEIASEMSNCYRNYFKLCAKTHSIDHMALFADRCRFLKMSDVAFICREYLRIGDSAGEKIVDLNLIFMKLNLEMIRKSQDRSGSVNLITCIQLFTRRFIKFPNHKDTISGIGIAFESIALFKNNPNAEISNQLRKFIAELFSFLMDHADFVNLLLESNLFHGSEFEFFRKVHQANSSNLMGIFMKFFQSKLETCQFGSLLADNQDSLPLYELAIKLLDAEESFPNICVKNELILLELFANMVSRNNVYEEFERLLNACSKTYFLSDLTLYGETVKLLKISLLSFTSDILGEVIKKFVNPNGPLSVSQLCLFSVFPFSLWRSLEKTQIVTSITANLLSLWKYLLKNQSSSGLLDLIIGALANLTCEAVDLFKKEDLKELIDAALPSTLNILRNNTEMMVPVMKHKLAQSLHRLLRGLLVLRDERLFDVIDAVVKLGSTDSTLSFFDTWKSISLLPLVKQNRDPSKCNKLISDRVNMVIPKLFSVSDDLSAGPQRLLQNYYRHALYFYMRYTQDVNFFNNPVIERETEKLIGYIQDNSQTWRNGVVYDNEAEDSIWDYLNSTCNPHKFDPDSFPVSVLRLQLSLPLKRGGHSTLRPALLSLRDDILALQKLIENFRSSNDEFKLNSLHADLQNIASKYK